MANTKDYFQVIQSFTVAVHGSLPALHPCWCWTMPRYVSLQVSSHHFPSHSFTSFIISTFLPCLFFSLSFFPSISYLSSLSSNAFCFLSSTHFFFLGVAPHLSLVYHTWKEGRKWRTKKTCLMFITDKVEVLGMWMQFHWTHVIMNFSIWPLNKVFWKASQLLFKGNL